jgi:hypothetical protein
LIPINMILIFYLLYSWHVCCIMCISSENYFTTYIHIMQITLRNVVAVISLLSIPNVNFAQAPNLGTASNFVLFSSIGAVSNTGISQLTGNVGTNNGSSTGFGNVNGVMHDDDVASALCATDLLAAYNQLNAAAPSFFPAPLLGNGDTLTEGVYQIAGAATLNAGLILNAQGNANAVFIFQLQGALSTNAASKVTLINGAMACNVFWKVEGLVSMSSGTTMRGTIIANNGAINMNTNDTLEGRALSTTGAVTVDGVMTYTPIGCGSPALTGPSAPSLASTACYELFSTDGPVTNTGITYVSGDVGTNVGLTTGFDALYVTGTIHSTPDNSTASCAADLLSVYNYLDTLPYDIELLYPAQFGNNLVLTPHTYRMNGATTFTDTLYLNADGDADAVFVIQINGALSTSTYSRVVLINGTQAKNVYWNVNGAVDISDHSFFIGTIVGSGAVSLETGDTINGGAFTITGALATHAVTAIATTTSGCGTTTGIANVQGSNKPGVSIVPNPAAEQITVTYEVPQSAKTSVRSIINMAGQDIVNIALGDEHSGSMIIPLTNVAPGMYMVELISGSQIVTQRLIKQ